MVIVEEGQAWCSGESALSHQVVGSKQPLRIFCGGRACLGLSLPQTPLMWEPPALGLPCMVIVEKH